MEEISIIMGMGMIMMVKSNGKEMKQQKITRKNAKCEE
jgi:hypothetical protein